ncbi:MAG TPA: tetratricopeptide repeat protein [Rhizomicrobium sp.]|nr:tetratricopeptide repeat protein [Rhizomicrobium sp.]
MPGLDMRVTAAVFLLMLAPLAAAAQTTTITISNSACTSPPAPADVAAPATPSIAAGNAAARNRDFALARANFLALAEKGDPDAERAMGQLLMQNCTGLQNKTAAVDWLTKAAATGNVPAEDQLGRAYMSGFGVAQDDAKAFVLFSQAAATADPVAQMELGYLYLSGRGVAQDRYQGLQWTVKAAEQGNAVALGNIAQAYNKGQILERDTDRAAYFLALANQRATIAQRNDLMGIAEEIRQAVSVDDLDHASKRAQRWTPGPGSLRDVLSDADDFRKHKR